MPIPKSNKKLWLCAVIGFASFGLTLWLGSSSTRAFQRPETSQTANANSSGTESETEHSGGRFNYEKQDRKLASRDDLEMPVFHGPRFQLYHDSGFMNTEILDLAGVRVQDRSAVQSAIEQEWAAFSRDFEALVVEHLPAKPRSREIATYRLKGSVEASSKFKLRLKEAIEEVAGEAAARTILQYLDTPKHFARLGAFDSEITLFRHESRGEPLIGVNYSIRDPASERVVQKGSTTDPLGYWGLFGDSFSLQSQ